MRKKIGIKRGSKLSIQRKNSIKLRRKNKIKESHEDGNFLEVVSTGSTLLDLAISGGRVRGGGLPGGIFVEIFGPSSAGKTVLLSEIAGAVKRKGGEVMFKDPESRLNSQFAAIFDLNIDEVDYSRPKTVPEIFEPIKNWNPKNTNIINGLFADSLAALSTDMEQEDKDQYGMRRAKEFSENLRKSASLFAEKNILMVASNQIRENVGAMPGQQKYKSPGGQGIGFYASLRLQITPIQKIKRKERVNGKEVTRVVGVESEINVFKSSIWKPLRTARITIIFDYGIDDIRQNLQFIKTYTKYNTYTLGGETLDKSMEKSIQIIEEDGLEEELKNEVIDLWEEIEKKFDSNRKKKRR